VATAETFICSLAIAPLVLRNGRPAAHRAGFNGSVVRAQFSKLPDSYIVTAKQALHLIVDDDCGILQAV
jgi:hypothetical protein